MSDLIVAGLNPFSTTDNTARRERWETTHPYRWAVSAAAAKGLSHSAFYVQSSKYNPQWPNGLQANNGISCPVVLVQLCSDQHRLYLDLLITGFQFEIYNFNKGKELNQTQATYATFGPFSINGSLTQMKTPGLLMLQFLGNQQKEHKRTKTSLAVTVKLTQINLRMNAAIYSVKVLGLQHKGVKTEN